VRAARAQARTAGAARAAGRAHLVQQVGEGSDRALVHRVHVLAEEPGELAVVQRGVARAALRAPAARARHTSSAPGRSRRPAEGARLRVALQARPPGRPGGVGVLDHLAEQRAEGGRRVRVRRAAPPLVGLLGLAAGALARRRLALLALAPLRRGRLRARPC